MDTQTTISWCYIDIEQTLLYLLLTAELRKEAFKALYLRHSSTIVNYFQCSGQTFPVHVIRLYIDRGLIHERLRPLSTDLSFSS